LRSNSEDKQNTSNSKGGPQKLLSTQASSDVGSSSQSSKKAQETTEQGKFTSYTPYSSAEGAGAGSNSGENSKLDSLGAIFTQDHEEVSGLRRVIKKSLIFLGIHLASLLGLAVVGLNLFDLPLLVSLAAVVGFITISNIFYIIVADRSYVWISLIAQFVVLIFAHSFVGLGFEPVTLFLALLMVIFSYSAYADLEKVQLSSRLFSISHITSEATRALITGSLIVIALGVYNGITRQTTADFVDETVFQNDFFMEKFIIPGDQALLSGKLTLNSRLLDGTFRVREDTVQYYDRVQENYRPATVGDFLEKNYKQTPVLDADTKASLPGCSSSNNFQSSDCASEVEKEEKTKLREWKTERYPGFENRKLSEEVSIGDYKDLTATYYINQIEDFENPETKEGEEGSSLSFSGFDVSKLQLIPRESIIPAFIAIVLYLTLSLVKFVFGWLSFILTVIIWNILKWTGFVQIDIETVEAEIVSI
jgi:hypothetical protein